MRGQQYRIGGFWVGLSLLLVGIIGLRFTSEIAAAERPLRVLDAASTRQVAQFGRGWINDLEWSPDGTTLAVATSAGVWLYSDTQAAPRLLDGHTRPVSSVTFSHDGERLVSGGWDGTVRVWEVARGEELAVLTGAMGDINSVAVSADGSLIAGAGFDYRIWLWAVDGDDIGSVSATVEGYSGSVESLAFSPDGRTLASGGRDNMVWLWGVAYEDGAITAEKHATLEGHEGWVNDLIFTRDGETLISGSRDGDIRLWDVEQRRTLETLESGELVSSVALSPDEAWLASGHGETSGSDFTVHLWDAATGEALAALAGHDSPVSQVAFSADGTRLASASTDSILRFWSLAPDGEAETEAVITEHSGSVNSVAFDADAQQLIAGSGDIFSNDTRVRLWDVDSGELAKIYEGASTPVSSVLFSPDSRLLVAGGQDGSLRLWQTGSGELRHTLEGHTDTVLSLAFSADGQALASGSEDQTVRIWDMQGELLDVIWQDGPARTVSLDSQESAQRFQNLVNITVLEDEDVKEFVALCGGHNVDVSAIAFNGNKSLAALGDWNYNIQLVNPDSGEQLLWLRGHTRYVTSLAFSPDGKLLASASYDDTVRLWDVETGAELAVLRGHDWPVLSVTFSADGSLLASGSQDGTVRLWASE